MTRCNVSLIDEARRSSTPSTAIRSITVARCRRQPAEVLGDGDGLLLGQRVDAAEQPQTLGGDLAIDVDLQLAVAVGTASGVDRIDVIRVEQPHGGLEIEHLVV